MNIICAPKSIYSNIIKNNNSTSKAIKKSIFNVSHLVELECLRNFVITNTIPNHPKAEGLMLPIKYKESIGEDVYIRDNVIANLYKMNQELPVHIIHHELCHAKDLENLTAVMSDESLLRSGEIQTKREDILFELGYIMWSEYIAYYNSYSSYVDSGRKTSLIYYADKSDIQFQLFRNNHSKEEEYSLYQYVDKKIERLFYSIAKEMGYCHASNNIVSRMELDKLLNFLNGKFGNWIRLVEEKLLNLKQIYPDQFSEKIFIELGSTLFKLYEYYGIYLINDEYGKISFEIK